MERTRIRSWKERWDPKAEFVFAKRLKLGLADQAVVLPGDPVDKTQFSLQRLRRWWTAGAIRLADQTSKPKDTPCVVRLTADVWETRVPGQEPMRFNSLGAAQAALVKKPKRKS